jgi:hypothetical protein
MEPSRPKVLLVNGDKSAAHHLLNYLRSLGCLCSLTRSHDQACDLFRRDEFDLVLSRFTSLGGACHELVMLSAGTRASFFYFYAVENGCWWIPRVRFGQECWGEIALDPRQFAHVLEKLIQEIANAASAVKEAAAETTRRHMQARGAAPALQPFAGSALPMRDSGSSNLGGRPERRLTAFESGWDIL